MGGCYRKVMKKTLNGFQVLISVTWIVFVNLEYAKSSFVQNVTIVTSYRSIFSAGLYDCIAECQASRVCKSVLYKPDPCECGLLLDNITIRSTSGVIYIDVTTWEMDLTGPGINCTCPSYTTCLLKRNGKTRCVEESIPCGDPPEVQHAILNASNGSDYRAGSVITYTCVEGFLNCGAMKRMCRKSGSWSPVRGHCVNSSVTFTDSKMSNKKLPCSARSWKMTIIGTPTERDFFSIWLFGRRKPAVIVRVYLSHDNCNDTILMAKDSKAKACGTKVLYRFGIGIPFRIDIIFIKRLYMLHVEDKFIKSLHGGRSRKMVIRGSVTLDNVTFKYS